MPYRVLRGRRAIVTGASSGIGKAISRELVEQGANVVLMARREDRLRELAEELASEPNPDRGQTRIVVGDVTNAADREAAVQQSVEAWGGLDILVNNAGFGQMGPFLKATSQDLESILNVNVIGLAEMTRTALPEMFRGQQPLVVNIGSILGHFALPEMTAYSTTKFAVRGFSNALRGELRGRAEVLLVTPATTKTEFFQGMEEEAAKSKWRPKHPTTPETVARQVVSAMIAGKKEVFPTWSAWFLCHGYRLVPGIFEWVLSRSFTPTSSRTFDDDS